MPGARDLTESEDVSRLCQDVMKFKGLEASICTTPALVLALFNRLEGCHFTCYQGYEDSVSQGMFSDWFCRCGW